MKFRSNSLVLLTDRGEARPDRAATRPPAKDPGDSAADASVRFGFGTRPAGEPLRLFHVGAKARVSFVWWERNLDDPSPLFTERDGRIVTVVAVWPLDARGGLATQRLAEVQVRVWEMTDEVFAHLEARHRRFHLGRYDLVVWARDTGIRSVPTFDSGSVFRAILTSERPEAAAVRERIEDVLRGHARAA